MTRMLLQNVIAQISKYIPSYPPLQSFNASNPLAGLHELTFDDAVAQVAKYAPIFGSLPLHKYHQYWLSGKITIYDLDSAIKEFAAKHKLNPTSQALLMQLLLNKSLQTSLEIMDVKSRRYFGMPITGWIAESNQRVFRFVSRFYDIGQALWQMPVTSDQLFPAWCEYARVNYASHDFIAKLEINVYDALELMLQTSGIKPADYEQYLLKILFQIIGWASFVHWLEVAGPNPYLSKHGSVADLIAIWMAETLITKGRLLPLPEQAAIVQGIEFRKLIDSFLPTEAAGDCYLRHLTHYNWSLIWQAALEHNYRDNLIRQINLNPQLKANLPKAQALFCVDVRSEGLRRHLENSANYETFGTAGFFGIGFDFHFQHHTSRQNPDWSSAKLHLRAKSPRLTPMSKLLGNLLKGVLRTKKSFLGPLVLFDVLGLFYSLRIMANTLIPRTKSIFSHPELSYSSFDIFQHSNLSVIELSQMCAKLLRSIGLCQNFAELILICGHVSESVNNPYRASLDCGACGGNSGAPHALAFCQAVNDTRVREYLRLNEQIEIPNQTQFIAATHNTTTDRMSFYYNPTELTVDNLARLNDMQKDLSVALADLRRERQKEMSGQQNVDVRKADWAELQPELGQVNNAALVIAPRRLTKNLNLQRRVFLQSYDYRLDADGQLLNEIFNTTVKVVNMINGQYYFSTTDYNFYGSGNKVIQNIVSQLGVMEGNSSDLKIGLTQQSLFFQGEPIHLPLRLCIIVEAPPELLEKVLAKNQFLADLIQGGWVKLHSLKANSLIF